MFRRAGVRVDQGNAEKQKRSSDPVTRHNSDQVPKRAHSTSRCHGCAPTVGQLQSRDDLASRDGHATHGIQHRIVTKAVSKEIPDAISPLSDGHLNSISDAVGRLSNKV